MAADWEWNTAVPLGTRDASRHCTPGVPSVNPLVIFLSTHCHPSSLSTPTTLFLNMSVEPVIRSLTPAISIFSVPFKRFGLIPFGGRSTAIKLASGDLWIVVSHPLTESTKAELARLGGNVK